MRWRPGTCATTPQASCGGVHAGEQVVIAVSGKPIAELVPVQRGRRRWLDRAELIRRLEMAQADPGLRDDLARLAGDTTDDLGPIR